MRQGELEATKAKLAAAERDLQYEQREREFTKQQHDAALARVKELELEIADYKGCDSPETHDHLHKMYLASEARVAELEAALREWIEGAERARPVSNFEKVTCYMRGHAAVAHARQVLEAKHEE